MKKLIEEYDVGLRRFPDEVLNQLGTISAEFMHDLATGSELMGRIFASFQAYMDTVRPWTNKFPVSNTGFENKLEKVYVK
ncbi:MAG: hypothetical protein QNK22_07335 [Xanthomonadales bacterium]|nr:hypothetical protein [Xanthomonadales bacterium]